MIIVRQIIKYHNWRTYSRLALDPMIILGQILRDFVNQVRGKEIIG